MPDECVEGRISIAAQKAVPGGPFRSLNGARSQIRVIDCRDRSDHVVHETPHLVEAPNWLPDGSALLLNGCGKMFRYDLGADLSRSGSGSLLPIDIGSIQDANNDHVISPDGIMLYISAGGAVYRVPVTGGEPEQVSPRGRVMYFLHGVSPDGCGLACTTIDPGSEDARWGIQIIPAGGGTPNLLLAGSRPVDGPEWSPDGKWIWFSGELESSVPGHAQLFRMRNDGSDICRMVTSPSVDWFPHPSPDGTSVSFIRYPKGTFGHPPDLAVELWRLSLQNGGLERLAELRGGQGTINVNSWSPDSRYIAYVAYPLID